MGLLKTWRVWVGCVISLLCLWLAFRHVPLPELAGLVARANPLLLLLAVVLMFLSVFTRAWRWVVLLEKEEAIRDSFWAQSVGFLFTNVFPLRLGEPARILVMADRCHLPFMHVTASAIVERLLDAAINVLILVLVLPLMHVPPLVKNAGLSLGILVLVGVGVLLLMVWFDQSGERLVRAICAHLPILPPEKIATLWAELVRGFRPLTRPQIAVRALFWSLATWGCSLATFWSVLCAFQPDGRLIEAAFMMVALSFAVAVPSSPGFIGVYQFVGQQALVYPFGTKYDAARALAITLTAHLVYYIVTSAFGLIGLWRSGESFVHLGRIITQRRPAQEIPAKEEIVPERPA